MTIQEKIWMRHQRRYRGTTKIKIIKGIGGKSFPNDYNWICPVCHNICRSWEMRCGSCERDKLLTILKEKED